NEPPVEEILNAIPRMPEFKEPEMSEIDFGAAVEEMPSDAFTLDEKAIEVPPLDLGTEVEEPLPLGSALSAVDLGEPIVPFEVPQPIAKAPAPTRVPAPPKVELKPPTIELAKTKPPRKVEPPTIKAPKIAPPKVAPPKPPKVEPPKVQPPPVPAEQVE